MTETEKRIAEITERCEAATPEPWDEIRRMSDRLYVGTKKKPIADVCNLYGAESENNLQFIAHARKDIPWLLSEFTARDAEIERLREAQRWVPVTERLPEYTANYNVVCNIGSMLGGYTDVRTYRFERIKGREPKWCIPDRFDEVVGITHWMPLPTAPEEGEGNER